jgi:hypothetical protein
MARCYALRRLYRLIYTTRAHCIIAKLNLIGQNEKCNRSCRFRSICMFVAIGVIASGVASPMIQSRYANIAMFINYQHN